MRIMRAIAAGTILAATMTSGVAWAAPELSTRDQLKTRRYVAAGDRAYVMGFEDGRFYAQGWHVTGEMGGVWSQPLKLVDGVWFSIDGQWLPPATRFTSGWGYTRMDFPDASGLKVSRTDFAPDGRRAALFGLGLRNPGGAAKTVTVAVDAHSELMSHYPWAWTTPNSGEFNAPDSGAFTGQSLEFGDTGNATSGPHDWAAAVGSNTRASGGEAGEGHWGSQAPPVLCTAESQFYCDEGPFGKGTGGQLRYRVTVPAHDEKTLWIGVAGSDKGLDGARAELTGTLASPARALADKIAARERLARNTRLSLPGDPQLEKGIEWGKQNIADLTQRADDLKIRFVNEGKDYPPTAGTVPHARWIGAGYPDYPWIFATDAEYTAFAAVTVGQFGAIEDHARVLRDVSEIVNGNSGKVAHEIVGDGSVYYGGLQSAGNTDETAKFPSLVALIWRWTGDNAFRDDLYPFTVRNMHYVVDQLDADHDGWPEGLGNVERTGMGEEKLDNSVYTIRGLFDLADMARAKGDTATATWARDHARDLLSRFEGAWWFGGPDNQYADSLDDPGDFKLFQKHWIGETPMEAELTRGGRAVPGLATYAHGNGALAGREGDCYSGTRPYNLGLFHTGCGGGENGAGERVIFGQNTAIQAVGEGNYGRLAQQRRYTSAEVEPMFGEPYTSTDPAMPVHHTPGTPDEQPGASPEIFPSPDFDAAGPRDANVERCTRCRSMVMQAWNQYGTMWPVVHQQLGVRPDLGRGRLTVVPQLPSSAPIAGADIKLGSGRLNSVKAWRDGRTYGTQVKAAHVSADRLVIGHTLPRGASVRSVKLDGHPHSWHVRRTNRGVEVTVTTRPGTHTLEVKAG
jgi:hypothetical protein